MRAVLRFLGSRWFLSFVGVALLAVLVWLFGPFLSYLEDWMPRAVVIAVMVLIWLASNLWLDRRRSEEREPPWSQGVTAGPGRSRRRRIGRGSRGAAGQARHRAGAAEAGVAARAATSTSSRGT